MREFELIIDEALKNGLSPEYSLLFNSNFLWAALGFRCGKTGIEAYLVGDNPLPDTIDMHYVWPFPQYLVGERYNFLVVRDPINLTDYIYHISDDHTIVTFVFAVDSLTFGTGWLMDVADFGEYAFIANGVCMVYWNVMGAWNSTIGTPTLPLLGTVCNFKGQMIGGNVRSAWHDCDEKSYIWSRIGSIEFTPDKENEAGYRRCPYGGEVYHVRRLGDVVVGYSSKGICLLTPSSSPAVTFGCKELLNIGLCNRGAVNGSLDHQVFVGEDLVVREITREGIKELGYHYWMEELDDIGEDIIVTYDRAREDFFIGNSTQTFLLSPNGMTEIPQHPSAVWRGEHRHIYLLPETIDANYKPIITTNALDMGYKGQKTTFLVETDAFFVEGAHASVDWANDLITWGYGNFVPINNNGIATTIASGNFFLFNLRFDAVYPPFSAKYIKVRYKMTDMRGMRGVYAPPPRGQA